MRSHDRAQENGVQEERDDGIELDPHELVDAVEWLRARGLLRSRPQFASFFREAALARKPRRGSGGVRASGRAVLLEEEAHASRAFGARRWSKQHEP